MAQFFGNFRYIDVAQLVHNYINTNCANVGSNQLPNRSSSSWQFFAGTDANLKGSFFKYTVTNFPARENALPTPSLSDNHFGSFLSSRGITNINAQISRQDFINLLLDIGKFCAAKILFFGDFKDAIPSSTNITHNVKTYLIYDKNGSLTNPDYKALGSTLDYKLIEAADVNSIINTVTTQINNTIAANVSNRIRNAKYSITFSASK